MVRDSGPDAEGETRADSEQDMLALDFRHRLYALAKGCVNHQEQRRRQPIHLCVCVCVCVTTLPGYPHV